MRISQKRPSVSCFDHLQIDVETAQVNPGDGPPVAIGASGFQAHGLAEHKIGKRLLRSVTECLPAFRSIDVGKTHCDRLPVDEGDESIPVLDADNLGI